MINKYNSSKQAQNDKKAAVSVEKKLGIWHDIYVLKLEEKNFQSLTRNNLDKLEIGGKVAVARLAMGEGGSERA